MVMGAAESSSRPAASKAARFSWAMFDWANQPFFTVITTFIFAPYFAAQMVGDPIEGQALWGYTQSIAGVVIAILSPFLGAIADAGGPRKPWIFAFQTLAVIGCILLWWALPGRPDVIGFVMFAIVVATIGAELSIVFNNALLPTLVSPSHMGRLSGFGWAMGYLGGLVALFITLIVTRPELLGLTVPADEALFGLDRVTFQAERLTGPASALWLVVFVVPMFLFTPDVVRTGRGQAAAVRLGTHRLIATIRNLGRYRNPALFLAAFMAYNDGLAAVIAFGGIYAAGIFGWGTTELGSFGIILTVLAALGAFLGGSLDDRWGSKPTIVATIIGVAIATLGILSVTGDGVLFFIELSPRAPGAIFVSTQEQVFLGFSILLGICMGPMQAASRTMIGRLAPPEMIGEFYGLFALSGKATAFLAPFTVAVVTQIANNQRAGLVVIFVFLVAGWVLLLGVRESRD